jgi:arylsulfatase A-like enzyme
MDRREFIKTGAAMAAVAQTGSLAAGAAKTKRKPNILYVFSDEHRACSLPGEPYNEALAPTLAAFKKKNLSFENCISNYPVCTPYRGILITGKWPYQSGMIDNDLQLADNSGSIGRTFRDKGYYTGYIGKWHLSKKDDVFIPSGPGRQGFEDWHLWANTNPHFDKSFTFNPVTGAKIQPKGYNCTLMTDEALKFIDDRKAAPEKPWLLFVSWNPPHPPFLDAPLDEMQRYDPAAMKLRPNVKLNAGNSPVLASEDKLRKQQQGYYGHISAVDREFERVLAALDASGQADNTIVIYTSDHGEMMGSHGYMGKRMPQEESCRVPFFIRYPERVTLGRESSILFSTADIYPTLCGLADIETPSHCVGKDLSGVVRGEKVTFPESVFLMHIQKDNATGGVENAAPLFRGVRTDRFTYAVADNGRWCLYDNRNDPFQQQNLVADASRHRLMSDLDGVVMDWLKKAQDPYPYAQLALQKSNYSE